VGCGRGATVGCDSWRESALRVIGADLAVLHLARGPELIRYGRLESVFGDLCRWRGLTMSGRKGGSSMGA